MISPGSASASGTVHGDGDALARRRSLDDAQLRGRHLELEAAARHARALGAELDQLAADAAADDLDGVAGTRRAARGQRVGRRLSASRAATRSVAPATKVRSVAGVRLAPQRVQHGPALRAQLAQELAGRLEVVGPARSLPRSQVGAQRLRLAAHGGQALGFLLGGRARGFQVATARLESLDRARDVAALSRQQPLRDLQRARREAVATRDRQREALPDAVVVEPVSRRAAAGIEVEGGDLERRLGERERLHLREVRGEDQQRTAREQVGEKADRERRALHRIGAGARLVQQHQARRTRRAGDGRQVLGVTGEGGQVVLDRLLVADVRRAPP